MRGGMAEIRVEAARKMVRVEEGGESMYKQYSYAARV